MVLEGGIIVASKTSMLKLDDTHLTNNTISVSVRDAWRNVTWTLTVVYGLQGDLEKKMFIRELKQLKNMAGLNWMILGDFNLICHDRDKN